MQDDYIYCDDRKRRAIITITKINVRLSHGYDGAG